MIFKKGSLVRYIHDNKCVGLIIAIGSNMIKIRWRNTGVEEWMPEYALEVFDESR